MQNASEEPQLREFRSARELVWENPDIGGNEKLVMLRLVENWPRIFPSQGTLARYCGISTRTVSEVLVRLKAKGAITIEPRYRANGGQTSSRYTIVGVRIVGKSHSGGGGGDGGDPLEDFAPPPPRKNPRGGYAAEGTPPPQNPLTKPSRENFKLKVVAAGSARSTARTPPVRRTRATPAALFTSLEGWEISDELSAEWLQLAALPCPEPKALELLKRRVERMRRRPIGGANGISDRDGYVRDHFAQWAEWERENLEKAHSRAALAPRSSFWGGGGAWAPSRGMKAYANTWQLEIDPLAAEFVRSGEAARHGGQAGADRAFIALLKKAAQSIKAVCVECHQGTHAATCSRAQRKAPSVQPQLAELALKMAGGLRRR